MSRTGPIADAPAHVAPISPIPSVPAHSAPKPAKRVAAYDGLRGVCALMVLLHHVLLTQPVFANYEWHLQQAVPYSWIDWLLVATPLRLIWAGQERALLFFVLSGFVLSLPWLDKHPAPYGRYLLGRFCRIYPPYLAAIALAALGSTLLGERPLPNASIYIQQMGWVFKPSWASLLSMVGVLNNSSSEYMDEALWSLVWEVRVAFILPLLMMPIMPWRNYAILPLYGILFALNHIVPHLISPKLAHVLNNPGDTFYFAEYFLFGIVIAVNRPRLSAWSSRLGGWPGVALLVAGCLTCWAPWPVSHDHMVGIGASMILAAILASNRVQAWLTNKPLLWLGRQSYSLYLIHVPLVMVTVILFKGVVPLPAFILIAPAIILAAELFRRWVEMPSVAIAQRLTGYDRGRRKTTGKPQPGVLTPQKDSAVS